MTKQERLDKLNLEISTCSKCVLHPGCSHVVFGSGNPDAQIMFVGEAPGKKEDETGVPFVGSSGRILDQMLAEIKLNRDDVYLTNISKCRPPKNRDPLPEEVAACWPWLEKQIEIIDPKIIITLGRYALNSFLPQVKISQVHGTIIEVNLEKLGPKKIFALHHPAAARCNRKTRAFLTEDFHKIPMLMKQIQKKLTNFCAKK